MHKSTALCRIRRDVKLAVYERDRGVCVICGAQGLPEAHVIPRSKLGLGVEQNIVTLCRTCHRLYDGEKRQEYGEIIKKYLKHIYPDWDESKLMYKKGENINE